MNIYSALEIEIPYLDSFDQSAVLGYADSSVFVLNTATGFNRHKVFDKNDHYKPIISRISQTTNLLDPSVYSCNTGYVTVTPTVTDQVLSHSTSATAMSSAVWMDITYDELPSLTATQFAPMSVAQTIYHTNRVADMEPESGCSAMPDYQNTHTFPDYPFEITATGTLTIDVPSYLSAVASPC
jgi:hypothetical protein